MKNVLNYILFAVAIGVASCSQLEQEYTVSPKLSALQDELCYVDGFLIKGTPIPETDFFTIAVVNAFGRYLRFEFNDLSEQYGFRVVDGVLETKDQGDVQYAKFAFEGTPTVTGYVAITYQVFEGDSDESLFGTLSSSVFVWETGTTRPAAEMIPTAENPFVFVKGEVIWFDKDPVYGAEQRSMYHRESFPYVSNMSVGGIDYGHVTVNIHYNSILAKDGVIAPETTQLQASNGISTITQYVLTALYPTAENLEENPEWFILEDGTTSDEWAPNDRFMHGSTPKAVLNTIYDENAAQIKIGANNSCKPLSSISWNMINWNTNNPLGSYVSLPGTYKIYIKYVDKHADVKIVDNLPKHPGTGEAGWIPFEFTIVRGSGFVLDSERDAADWRPTPERPMKPIRVEIVENVNSMIPFNFVAGANYGVSPNQKILRVWFALHKDPSSLVPMAYYYKPVQFASNSYGTDMSVVAMLAGTNSKISAGSIEKSTLGSIKYFEDDDLNDLYYLTYDNLITNNNTLLKNAGTYNFTHWIQASGSVNPIPVPDDAPSVGVNDVKGLSIPLRITVVDQ